MVNTAMPHILETVATILNSTGGIFASLYFLFDLGPKDAFQGLRLGILSSLCLCLRNVLVKRFFSPEKILQEASLAIIVVLSAVASIMPYFVCLSAWSECLQKQHKSTYLFALCASIMMGGYYYLSQSVLQSVSAPMHSMLNQFKRLLVMLISIFASSKTYIGNIENLYIGCVLIVSGLIVKLYDEFA